MNILKLTNPIRCVLIVLCLLIASCSQTPKKKDVYTQITSESTEQSQANDPEKLLLLARKATNNQQKSELLLKAAQVYFDRGLGSQAKAILQEVEVAAIGPDKLNNYWQLTFDVAMLEQDLDTLSIATEQLKAQQYFAGTVEEQLASVSQLEQAYALMKQPAKSALLLIEQYRLLPFIEGSDGVENTNIENLKDQNDKIWNYLKLSTPDELAKLSSDIALDELQGWLLLSQSIHFQRNSLKQQHVSLTEWLEKWPNHSAALALPKELQILQKLPENRAQEIVLALPLTGQFAQVGQAISDGFMASYFGASDFSNESLKVSFYDTNNLDFLQLYEREINQNSVIVGPLEKDTLLKLSEMDSVPVQTIALNQVETSVPTLNLFQFSLRPEQEATQIIERLNNENKRRIAVLAPENAWGRRIEQHLIKAIETQGVLSSNAQYSTQKTLAKAVAKLLATDQSKQRARLVQDIAGLRLETTPRRRQDLDAIVMIAKPEMARQLKPLLAFHYASDIPVYASSQINEASAAADNRDLNGIRFLDMPWVLNHSTETREQIQENLPDTADRYDRFYAMGADAYALAPRIELLTQVDNSYIDGQTGKLSINALNTVERELKWARFRNGKVVNDQ